MQIKLNVSFPSITSLLKICTTPSHLQQVHAQIVRQGLEQDHVLISQFMVCLSKTYGLSDSGLDYSTGVFDRVLCPSTGLWNVLVKGFCEKSRFVEAVSVFVRMKREEGFADGYTYPLLIKLCASEVRFREGRAFHGSALSCGVDLDVFVRTSLINFYGKFNQVGCARKLFDEMPLRSVVSWTAMVAGYVVSGDLAEAKKLFDEMPKRNIVAWNAMIDGFVKSGDLYGARRVFDEAPEKNAVSYTTMIDGYAKSGDMASARVLFDRAPRRDLFAWSALISGYTRNGQLAEAMTLFADMSSAGVKPDEHIATALISACSKQGDSELAKWVDGYVSKIPIDLNRVHVAAALVDMNAKCGNIERAKELFEKMPDRDLISYCSMIQGLSVHGRGKEAVKLFDRMVNEEGLAPDEVAFTVILTACSRAGLVAEGLGYFESLKKKRYSGDIVPSSDHYACVVDLLSRSGDLKTAHEILKPLPVETHGSAWAALLGACKLHGDVELGESVAARLLEAEPRSSGGYVLLSQIYAERERWLDVSLVRDKMKEKGVQKLPGCSWINSES